MKRIVLKCRANFTLRGKEKKYFTFEKGKAYEVEDAVAKHAFIKERLLSVEDVKKTAPVKSDAEKGSEDVQSTSND